MERERGAAVTCDGRLFHRQVAATGNVLSPTMDRLIRSMVLIYSPDGTNVYSSRGRDIEGIGVEK